MTVSIRFLGAAGTVTGSKYLVQHGSKQLLIDCGLFQGEREWRERNWRPIPVPPKEIDAVLLTHAHIDHTGMLPRVVGEGLRAPVYCTGGTKDLCQILLPDSAKLQEEEAEYRERTGRSRHHPALPLYTQKDAAAAIALLKPVPWNKPVEVVPGIRASWNRVGHILGAGSILLEIGGRTITFSGDIGRYDIPILVDPQPTTLGDLLLIESTYGDRDHPEEAPAAILGRVIRKTAERGGVTVIPAFAVGRTQLLLYYLRELKEQRAIPDIPIIIDSPMARDATEIYLEHTECYDEQAKRHLKSGSHPFLPSTLHFVQDREESKKLNRISEPMVIISASGMLSGGRILHHLYHRISSPLNTILFVGYQPKGGRGDWLLSGAKSLRLLHEEVEVKAEIAAIDGLSAHGDRNELVRWLKSCGGTPNRVAVVHGDREPAQAFAKKLRQEFSWEVGVPQYEEEWTI